ncbi:helix-turn-helix transcriptional regulator [Marinomonas sp.]|nr:helix-turn-helix transcriptional regulator [Marinomonas sp.]
MKSMWYVGLSEDFLDWYIKNDMIKHDLVTSYATYQPPGKFESAASRITADNTKGDYEKWLKDQSMIDTAWLVISSTEEDTTFLAIQRTPEQGYYSEDDLTSLNYLVPHIRQAIQIYDQLSGRKLSDSTFSSIINAFPLPTVILNDSAKVLYLNQEASRILESLSQLDMKSDRLAFQKKIDNDEFLNSMTKVTRSSIGLNGYGRDVFLLERKNLPSLVLTLTPITDDIYSFNALMINIFDATSRETPSAHNIMHYYSLTQAEANLCEELLKGMSLKDIAISSNKSELTLRTYLKQVYQKTGFKRQGGAY